MKINKTTNYDMFVVDPANRSIRKAKKLFRSMKEYGWLMAFPMFCKPEKSGKKVVLDGQHRLEVARELKIPVLYVCDENAEAVNIPQINDAAMPWKLADYLSSFCNQGEKDYLEIKEYHERTGLKLNLCISLFSNLINTGGGEVEKFRSGLFKIKTVTLPSTVEDVVSFLKKHISWATDSSFICALARCCLVKDFKVSNFKAKVDSAPSLLIKQVSIEGYLELIEEIYNYRAHCPIPLKFLCEQEVRKRSAIQPKQTDK